MSDSKEHDKRMIEASLEDDVETLLDELDDPDPDRRYTAVFLLKRMNTEEAIDPFIDLLSDSDFQVRATAARGLAKLRATKAVPELLACIDRGPEDVMREWAIYALAQIGSSEAVPKIIKVLKGPNEGLHKTAALALGEIGDTRAVEPLEEAARATSWIKGRHCRRALRLIRAKEQSRGRRAFNVAAAAFLGALLAVGLILTGAPLWLRILGTIAGVLVIWRLFGWTDFAVWRAEWQKARERDRGRR